MKKHLPGFITGVIFTLVLTFGATAFAENVSKIGKRISAEFVVKLDGEALPVKAVAFDGTSYAPVRAIGEALGLDVDFIDSEVILTSNVEKEADVIVEKLTAEQIKERIIVVNQDIEILERAVERSEDSLRRKLLEFELRPEAYDNKTINEIEERIEGYKIRINEAQQELADLERQLAELQAAE